MRTKIFIGVGVLALVAAGIVWRFGFYTYFQRTVVDEEMPATVAARTVVAGSFVDVDLVHRGSGTAKIVEDNGRRFLRLENFEVTNGPDLYVYLSESKQPGSSLESLSKYISLGLLKGNAGDQNYDIPAIFRGYDTVVIWCQKYGVLFSYAVMEEPEESGTVCTADAKLCPDGSYVGRQGPRCEFAPCPGDR